MVIHPYSPCSAAKSNAAEYRLWKDESEWAHSKDLGQVPRRFRSVVEGAQKGRVLECVNHFPQVESYAGLFDIVSI